MSRNSRSLRSLEWLPTLWNGFAYFFPGTAMVLTGIWARVLENPLPWPVTIFLAAGVFAFFTVAAYSLRRFSLINDVYERLSLSRLEVVPVSPDFERGTVGIILCPVLRNANAVRPIYLRIDTAEASLNSGGPEIKPTENNINEMVSALAPLGEQPVQISVIPGLPANRGQITGYAKLTVYYGRKPDKLKYRLRIEWRPAIEVHGMDQKFPQATFTAPIIKYEHKRTWEGVD